MREARQQGCRDGLLARRRNRRTASAGERGNPSRWAPYLPIKEGWPVVWCNLAEQRCIDLRRCMRLSVPAPKNTPWSLRRQVGVLSPLAVLRSYGLLTWCKPCPLLHLQDYDFLIKILLIGDSGLPSFLPKHNVLAPHSGCDLGCQYSCFHGPLARFQQLM